ncbi:hypothetical protein ACP4OV_026444 [Aristida adscensionis]
MHVRSPIHAPPSSQHTQRRPTPDRSAMAVTSEGEREVAVAVAVSGECERVMVASGEGVRAVAVPGEGKPTVAASGEGKPVVAVSVDVKPAVAASGKCEREMAASGGGVRGVAVACEVEQAVAVSGDDGVRAVAVPGEVEQAVAVSGEGQQAVGVSGEGKPAVVAGQCEPVMAASGEGVRVEAVPGDGKQAVAASGEGERVLLHSLDYPCTRRLRLRRLVAYLRRFGHGGILEVVNRWKPVIFRLGHMGELVEDGKWGGGGRLRQGLHRPEPLGRRGPFPLAVSHEIQGPRQIRLWVPRLAYALHRMDQHRLHGSRRHQVPLLQHRRLRFPLQKLRSYQAFLDFQLVREKAAKMVKELIRKTPELKERLRYPVGRNDMYHVLPIGSSVRRKRPKKSLGRKQSTDLAQFYLWMKKRLLSCQRVGADYSGFQKRSEEPLIALFEKALEAGRRQMLKQVLHPPQSSSKEGVALKRTMQAGSSFMVNPMRSQGDGPGHLNPVLKQGRLTEHSSKRDAPQSSAIVAFQETNSGKTEAFKLNTSEYCPSRK